MAGRLWSRSGSPERGPILGRECFGQKRVIEGFGKSVDFLKIVYFIGVALPKNPVLDELENNLPDLRAVEDSPIIENRLRHGTKIF